MNKTFIKKIKTIIRHSLSRLIRRERVPVQVNFLNKDIKVLPGTIKEPADKDDAWLQALLQSANIVFDVGANIGYTAIISTLHNRDKQLILIDPNPSALSAAAKNLIINGLSANVRFYNAFVSDRVESQVKFYSTGLGAAGSMYKSHAKTAAALNSFYWVNTTTIDFLSDYYQLIPDLVKIDVEGAEYLVLNGATQLASRQHSYFFVEMHAVAEYSMLENAANILTWCQKNHYKAYYLKEHIPLSQPDQIAHRGRCHLLLLPHLQEYPYSLRLIPEGGPLLAIS